MPSVAPQTAQRSLCSRSTCRRSSSALTHPNDPDLNRHVASAVAKDSPRGWRVDKAHRIAQIDAVIALAMAVERAEQKVARVELIGWL